MADLDDFFAKKDKKKSKKKFTTSEELAKKLDEKVVTAPPQVPKKKERPVDVTEPGQEKEEEDEWKEVKEDQARDYSGLKIGQMTINEEEQELDADGEPVEGNELNAARGNSSAPWKGGTQPSNAGVGKPTLAAVAEAGNAVYISPTVRNATRLRKGVAPDISNEEYFPSLGADKPAGPLKKGGAFEEIKHGARPAKQSAANTPVSVANRFTSLADGTLS